MEQEEKSKRTATYIKKRNWPRKKDTNPSTTHITSKRNKKREANAGHAATEP